MLRFPFDINFNRETFLGIFIGIVLVAIVRAYLGF